MIKILNQSNESIIAIGQEGSHIRNKEVYNITLPKLIQLINNNWMHTGIYRHTSHIELEYIMEDDNIPKTEWNHIIKSAYFYSIVK